MSKVPDRELAALSLNEYSCTFICDKTFSTSHEWCQHELTDHHQREMWRCDVHNSAGIECGAKFYSSAPFETHLSTAHGIADHDMEENHIHPNGQCNFWCGFCRQIKRLSTRGTEAWKERFDHIESHINKGLSVERYWFKLD